MVEALAGSANYVAGDLDDVDGTAPQRDRRVPTARRRRRTAALFEISYSEVAELRGDIAGATSAMAAALEVNTEAGFRRPPSSARCCAG